MILAKSHLPAPLFDAAHLARYTGGDTALKAELLDLMCTQARRCIALMATAPDRESWIAATHTLKGAARGVGAFALGDACEAVETLDAADWPAGTEAVEQAFLATQSCFATC
jgi:HPt (histidine-containing phosphotransfer) domain-containing protein